LLIGFSAADAQQSPPNPTRNPDTHRPRRVSTDEDEVIKVERIRQCAITAQDHNRRLSDRYETGRRQIIRKRPATGITAFSRQVDLPLSLAILIDVSVSQQAPCRKKRRCNVVSRNGK